PRGALVSRIGRVVAATAGALDEAWAEIRTHKLRVLLSLIGIGVAVAALTAVLALGEFQQQSLIQQSDKYGGREATLTGTFSTNDGSEIDWSVLSAQVDTASRRFEFDHRSRVSQYSMSAS